MPKHSMNARPFTIQTFFVCLYDLKFYDLCHVLCHILVRGISRYSIADFASPVRIPLKRETGKPTRLSFANLQRLCVLMVE